MQKTKTLVGIAVDVSGSMETSIRNEVNDELSRFESFQRALDRVLDEARIATRSRQERQEGKIPIDLFVYCFGLKDKAIEVADLLSLMRMGESGIRESKQQEERERASQPRYNPSQDPFGDLEQIARAYSKDGWGEWAKDIFNDEQAQALVDQLRDSRNASEMASYLPEGLGAQLAQGAANAGKFASQMGLGGTVKFIGATAKVAGDATGVSAMITEKLKRAEKFAIELIQQRGVKAQVSTEDEIRQRVSQRLKQKLDSIGDTTLSIGEVTDLWNQSDVVRQDFEDMAYGGTPMCKTLRIVKERLKRELSKQEAYPDLVLFLLSDGQPTDGDPLSIAKELREMGVSIICCLLDNKDVSDPRILFNKPKPDWNGNASLMFEMASVVQEGSYLTKFLLKKGWKINPQAKMFVQLNHSKVLEEFIQIILSPLDQEISDPLPLGDQ